jgi:hypothetical protein
MPGNFPLFKWHAQAVLAPLPKTIQTLVTSPQCTVEAISVAGRPYVIGLQFDNHAASVNDARTWVAGDQAWLSEPPAVDTDRLLADARENEALLGEQFDVLFENYIKLIV